MPRKPTRRDFFKVAGVVAGAGAVTPGRAAAAPADETLAGYSGHTTDGRSVTVTSTAGQQVRITAYGDHVVRYRAIRGGEHFFADDRYEMVDPASHASMGGSLRVVDGGDRLTITTPAADGVEVVLHKNPLRAEFRARSGETFAAETATRSLTWSGSVVRQSFAAPAAGERFVKAGHGLYGRAPKVDRTGDVVAHNYPLQSRHIDQAPAIVPMYLSSRGYAIFFNTTFDTTFDFGGTYGFSADGHDSPGVPPQLDYFVIKGPEFATLLDRYTRLTGRPRFPRLGVFGLQLSDKNFPGVSDQNWWTGRITALRGAGFPLDVQVNDNRWRTGSGEWAGSWFEFSPQRWPDPAGFKRWADEHGVLTTLDYNRNNSNEMAGWIGGPPPGYSFQPGDLTGVDHPDAVPDWSNPAARAWVWEVFWSKAFDPALGFPGDALWIDEPDELGPIPYSALAANGQRWSELRNAYFLYCQKGVGQEGWDRQVGRARRPWTFTRGATAGQQRYGHLWTGDIESTYAEMKEQIRGMQNAGLGGFPYANIDAGGFFGGVVSSGLYRNWVAAWASLSPVWRPHSNGDTAALGPAGSRWPIDQGTAEQADFLRYSRLRYTFMPYVYTIAHIAHATGVPMARAMVVDHQSNAMAYTHDLQYMWGPSILVMPVTTDVPGEVQKVWLPAGETWYDFWTDARHAGSDTAEKNCVTRTGEILMFVKAGSILPKYKYAQSTAFLDKTQLELDVYAGEDGSLTLYEDDGTTEDFRSNAAATTRISFSDNGVRTTIDHPAGTYAGAPAARRYVVRVHGLDAPVGMRVNGTSPAAFTGEAAAVLNGTGQVWDATRKVLTVVTPMITVRSGGTAATVEPSGTPFPAPSARTVHGAEDAARGGAVLASRHPGYTGTGYVDFAHDADDHVEWTVTVPAAGTRSLGFRYANGGTADRPLRITVNGAVVATGLSFPPTGDWRTWRTATLTAALPAGSVRIRATATGSSAGNLDCLVVD
ncbi:TIM-barrel domain-containing protein [Lentzea sp. NPDC060358]|uniref:TIM-barrel domain-containing protein n=1 Tax=Lentzea sp. NPDC060358 TaxID=3347103 RepID=UPI0036603D4C